ncbi:hypothetical protein [uncultured Fusobacterium sp.]|jgi:hypothetical protein|uniref:hypothetical protein n=1 Tax=uncultured Fusobacterium sp. TaxID=159267 RepID=UPI0027DAC487|nr:hypothetical protein [uncultured Fusobacterium sp.]
MEISNLIKEKIIKSISEKRIFIKEKNIRIESKNIFPKVHINILVEPGVGNIRELSRLCLNLEFNTVRLLSKIIGEKYIEGVRVSLGVKQNDKERIS